MRMTRLSGLLVVAAAGAALFVAGGLLGLVQGEDNDPGELVFAAATALTIAGLIAAARRIDGRLVWAAAILAGIGQLLIAAAAVAQVADENALSDTLFMSGFLPMALGIVGLGIALWRDASLANWSAFLLPVGLVVLSVLGDPGGIVFGAAWALLVWSLSQPHSNAAV